MLRRAIASDPSLAIFGMMNCHGVAPWRVATVRHAGRLLDRPGLLAELDRLLLIWRLFGS
jgi:hypothetical protein